MIPKMKILKEKRMQHIPLTEVMQSHVQYLKVDEYAQLDRSK